MSGRPLRGVTFDGRIAYALLRKGTRVLALRFSPAADADSIRMIYRGWTLRPMTSAEIIAFNAEHARFDRLCQESAYEPDPLAA